jgi:hypothetical protein
MTQIKWQDVVLYNGDDEYRGEFMLRQMDEFRRTGGIQGVFMQNIDGTRAEENWNDGPGVNEIDWAGFDEALSAEGAK